MSRSKKIVITLMNTEIREIDKKTLLARICKWLIAQAKGTFPVDSIIKENEWSEKLWNINFWVAICS